MDLLGILKTLQKKGMEAPSTLVVIIIFLVGLAIVILLILYFSGAAGAEGSGFMNATSWGAKFKWF